MDSSSSASSSVIIKGGRGAFKSLVPKRGGAPSTRTTLSQSMPIPIVENQQQTLQSSSSFMLSPASSNQVVIQNPNAPPGLGGVVLATNTTNSSVNNREVIPKVMQSNYEDYNPEKHLAAADLPDDYKKAFTSKENGIRQAFADIKMPGPRQLFWSSPRRKACSLVCMAVVFIILSYLIATIVETLKIINSAPSNIQLSIVEDLCSSNSLPLGISGDIFNPSKSEATIGASQAFLKLNDGRLLATIDTQEFFLKSKNSSLNIPCNITIAEKDFPTVRETLQNWINGKDVNYTFEFPIEAHFAANVFLFPVTISQTLTINRTLNGLGTGGNEYEDEYTPRRIKMIRMEQSVEVENFVRAMIAVNLWGRPTASRAFADITLPSITYKVEIDGEVAVKGKSLPIRYGKPKSLNEEVGVIYAGGVAGWDQAPGVHRALSKINNYEDFTMRITVDESVNTPDFTPTDNCFAQSLLQGIYFESIISRNEYENPSPEKLDEPSFVELNGINITQIASNGIITAALNASIEGLLNFNGLQGPLPRISVIVDTPGALPETRDPLIGITLRDGITLVPGQPLVNNTNIELEVRGLSEVLRAFDKYSSNSSAEFSIFVRTNPVNNRQLNTVFNYLLSALDVKINLREETNGTTTRRRELASEVDQTIALNVTSNDASATIKAFAKGFGTDELFGGVRIIWQDIFLQISTQKLSAPVGDVDLICNATLKGADSDSPGAALDALVKFFDSSNGALIVNLVNKYSNFESFPLKVSGNYGQGPTLDINANVQRSREIFQSSGSSVSSFIELLHAELESLTNSQISANTAFALDTGDTKLNVSLPKISVAFGRCNEPHFVSVSMSAFEFRTGINDFVATEISVHPENASEVIDSLIRFKNGEDQNFCIVSHPDEGNFISKMISSIGLDIRLEGLEQDTETNPTSIGDFEIVVTSDSTKGCTNILVDVDPSAVNSTFSFGWGKADAVFKNKKDNTAFFTIELAEGYIGTIDQFKKQNFFAPQVLGAINFTACLKKDPVKTVSQTVTSSRQILTDFLDGKAVTIEVAGTYDYRSADQIISMSAEFTIPNKTLEKLTAPAPSSSSSSSSSSSQQDEDNGSFVSFKAITVTKVDNGDISGSVVLGFEDIGVTLELPVLRVRLSQFNTSTTVSPELALLDFQLDPPRFDNVSEKTLLLDVFNAQYDRILRFINAFQEEKLQLLIGGTNSPSAPNYLSQVIPDIKIAFSDVAKQEEEEQPSATSAPTASTSSPLLDFDLGVASTTTTSTFTAKLKALQRLDFLINIGALNLQFFNGTQGQPSVVSIGTLTMSAMQLQEVNSGFDPLVVQFVGVGATELARRMFVGEDVPVGFTGTIGAQPFRASFSIPKELLTAVAIGAPEKRGDSQSSLEVTKAMLLGGNSIGSNIIFPCIFEDVCDDIIQLATPTGLTAGVSIGLSEPINGTVQWVIHLDSNVEARIFANGFEIGSVAVLNGLRFASNAPELDTTFTYTPIINQIPRVKETVTLFTDGSDIVITAKGATSNHISSLLAGIEQDFEFVGKIPDPNAPDLLGKTDLSLVKSNRTRLDIAATLGVTFTAGLELLVGDVDGKIFFGHNKLGVNNYELNAPHVASLALPRNFVLRSQPNEQTIVISAALHHKNPAEYDVANRLVSAFIWRDLLPLEFLLTITPTSNPYGATQSFTIATTLTVPVVNQDTGAIHSFGVDASASALSTFSSFNVKVKAKKVLKNTLSWPVLYPYYEYKIKLIDRDGHDTDSGFTSVFGCGGLQNAILPCTIGFCYPPLENPFNIIENEKKARSCALNNDGTACASPPLPLVSPMKDPATGQSVGFIEPQGLGSSDLELDLSLETGVRMWDEYTAKNMICADVTEGELWATMQQDPFCQDLATTTEAQLKCSYLVKVYINLIDYGLSTGETCGRRLPIPMKLGFSSFLTSAGPQFPGLQSPNNLVNGARWDINNRLNIADSFRITLTYSASDSGEAFSLIFRRSKLNTGTENRPTSTSLPGPNGGANNYAFGGLGNGHVGMIMATKGCNTFAVMKNSSLTPLKLSPSCAGRELSDGTSRTIRFTYDALNHRMEWFHSAANRRYEFDLDLEADLGARHAWLGIGASQTSGVKVTSVQVFYSRSDSTKTILEKALVLFKAGERGNLVFRARDPESRPRGRGGELFEAEIRHPVTGAVIPSSPAIVDNLDGTYTLSYTIALKGRYEVFVRCTSASCLNSNVYTSISKGLFIRAP